MTQHDVFAGACAAGRILRKKTVEVTGSPVVGPSNQSYNRRVSFGAILPLRGISPESVASGDSIRLAKSLLFRDARDEVSASTKSEAITAAGGD